MLINNFKLIKQKRINTCGYATAAMIISFLDKKNIDEDFLLKNEPFDENGITFSKLAEVYKKYLTNYNAKIVYGNKETILSIIAESIKDNIPLHILYLTKNLMGNKENVLHYSALIGFDEKNMHFTIADPYGSIRVLNEEDFFNAISFRNECLPDAVKNNTPSNLMMRFNLC